MFFYRRKLKREYEKLLNILDQILAGEKVDERFDESMDAAIVDRVKRIMERVSLRQERAEAERNTVKQLISDIAHQVRTPLANITLYSELLEESVDNPQGKKLAKTISHNADTLSFHLQELLKASYAEQEMIVVTPEVCVIRPILHSACQRVESFALEKEILIQMNIGEATARVDVKWTEEAIFNVLHNAVKYSPKESMVSVDLEEYESFLCIRVRDEGIGIPEDELGAVCNRFYRGSNVPQEKGLGIGLYLTREVLQRQQGYMKISSTEGVGTTVAMFLLK